MTTESTVQLDGDRLRWSPPGFVAEFAVAADQPVRILSLRPADAMPAANNHPVSLVELACLAEGHVRVTAASQHRPYAASEALRYLGHGENKDELGNQVLTLRQQEPERGLMVETRLEAWADVLRISSTVTNTGTSTITLAYLSSLVLATFGGGLRTGTVIHQARNAWCAELRWQELTPEQAGLVGFWPSGGNFGTTKARYAVTSNGGWSSGDFLPMGAIEAAGVTWTWQIEHSGAWHWELSDHHDDLCLAVSGPTDTEHQWRATLQPGGTHRTVPVAMAITAGGLADGLRALTTYRRRMRRPHEDNRILPVIFNDYMNCLLGDPTAAKLTPLIEAAASVGAEYFVIDAGWYADDSGWWWDSVGAWEASTSRFPDGLEKTMDEIRAAGMVPGLWLEPEVVGVRSEIAPLLPDDALFTREGHRVVENDRYHLDYRSAAVRERMDQVIDRLIADYGVGYFKFDYNINVVPGTDLGGEAPGAGLLGHNRAYNAWIDGLLDRHPGLVLENCSSGGLRMDYALLSRTALLSTSDQQDPIVYASIAAAAPSAVTPEQGAVWAYPQPEYDVELASFSMINALLGRIHLSGRIDLMSATQLDRVRAALDAYKSYRGSIPSAQPEWPLGLPSWYDDQIALGLTTPEMYLLSVWNRGNSPAGIEIQLSDEWKAVETLFPVDLKTDVALAGNSLTVSLPPGPTARLLKLTR